MDEVSFYFKYSHQNTLLFQDSFANHSNTTSNRRIKFIPHKGDWQGGDEVVIIMPYPIKQKGLLNSNFSIVYS